MGLAKADGTALNTINEAQNAMYTINGIKGEGSTNTIEALPGVKIELLKVTEPKVEGAPDASVQQQIQKQKGIDLKFTVNDSNVTDASNVIKKMVADYNKAVSTVDIFVRKRWSFSRSSYYAKCTSGNEQCRNIFSRWQLFIHIWYSIKARWNDGS